MLLHNCYIFSFIYRHEHHCQLHALHAKQMKPTMIVIGHSYEWRNNKMGKGINDIQHKLFNPSSISFTSNNNILFNSNKPRTDWYRLWICFKNTPKSSEAEPLYHPVSQDAAIEGSCIFDSLFHTKESDTLFPLQ